MSTINQLNAADALVSADQIPIYSSSNGDARKVSASVLRDYVLDGINAADGFLTQYAAPSATGFTATITDSSSSVWLVLTPVAGYAAGTIKLPSSANSIGSQEVLVNCTQSVTTLTVDGNGSTVTGAPTTLAANAFFRLRYDAVAGVWYRVG